MYSVERTADEIIVRGPDMCVTLPKQGIGVVLRQVFEDEFKRPIVVTYGNMSDVEVVACALEIPNGE